MGRFGIVGGWRAPVCAGVLLVLAACSAGGGSEESGPADRTPSAGEEAVSDMETTPPGTVLQLGDEATVVWRPSADLEGLVGLRVDGVREADPADFDGLVASGAVEGAQPYYVDVTVSNVGDTDLGGLDVPLYLLDTSDTYGPPWAFEEPFAPCRSRPLPESFAPGDTVRTCLVHFARAGATYDAMAFQPAPDVDAVTWTGEPEALQRADRDGPSRRGR